MKKNIKQTLMALSMICVLGAAALPAHAQDDNLQNKIVSHIDLEGADVRDALHQLFKDTGVSVSIAQDVQGTVTLTFNNKPFGTILTNILAQVDSTYRINGGIYEIIKKPQENLTGTTTDTNLAPTSELVIRRIPINHMDPELLFKLLSGKIQTVAGNIPETSTITNGRLLGGSSGGSGGGGGGFGGGGFGGGGGGGFGGSGGGGGGFGGGGGGFGGGGGGFGGSGGGGGFGGGGGGGF